MVIKVMKSVITFDGKRGEMSRSVFITLSNFYDGAFCVSQKSPS